MSEKITDLVVPENVTSPEMVYSNKVYLSAQGNIPPQKKYISLKGYVLPVAFSDTIHNRLTEGQNRAEPHIQRVLMPQQNRSDCYQGL